MRNMIAALAVGIVGAGFAVSAQAAPSTSLAPLSTLSQSSIEQVQYGYKRNCEWVTKYKKHCHYEGYGYKRHQVCENKSYRVRVCH
jgi:hypothetical protein